MEQKPVVLSPTPEIDHGPVALAGEVVATASSAAGLGVPPGP